MAEAVPKDPDAVEPKEKAEPRTKRQKRERLKSGSKKKYEVKELENVYETVDEREYYVKQVHYGQDDWIVDDECSGYIDDGRDIFDDDLDLGSINVASKQSRGVKRKKKSLSDNPQQLLSSMPRKEKEKELKKLGQEEDDASTELLEELDAPSTSNGSTIKPKSLASSSVFKQWQKMQDDVDNIKKPEIHVDNLNIPLVATDDKKGFRFFWWEPRSDEENESVVEDTEIEIGENPLVTADDKKGFRFFWWEPRSDEEQESVVEEAPAVVKDTETEIGEDLNVEFLSECDDAASEEWQKMQEGVNNMEQPEIHVDDLNIPLVATDDKKVFRFFWWDAFEDPTKQPGVVFLFGKAYCDSTKSYVSCCVAVRNIQRKVFVLPRPYKLNSKNEETEEAVTYEDVYEELNTDVLKPLNIKEFRSRYVNKKYAFDAETPAQSDYMEVRYNGSEPMITRKSGRTFSKIFGTNSSMLEILLLERKIKGPCWLDVTDPQLIPNSISWCKLNVNCLNLRDLSVQFSEPPPPPPLVVAAINMCCAVNPATLNNEIVMISCLTHNAYRVDEKPPNPPFQQHFCVFTSPNRQTLPPNTYDAIKKYKATRVQKMDTEKALMNYFVQQFTKIDADLIVGHDLQGYQINVLCDRLIKQDNEKFDRFGRLKRGVHVKRCPIKTLERELFVGRLVCDLKISAKELIKSRSYDLDSLCRAVLKLEEGQRTTLESDDLIKMYATPEEIIKLISMTMLDTAYILRMMYDLNAIPLALEITNIAGNLMARTLTGGRSELNEFLLLHAFSEEDYIVPDKQFKSLSKNAQVTSRNKPTYSGGLVLDPKTGFYDKLILLMDFNSLYPSIIQEYNICFTTAPPDLSEDNMVLPERNLPAGILPTEIRKLVESRRQVKKLMNNPDISDDLRSQYRIRQMALKLTANSVYGCLGFSNSRFYAKNLAALVTHKGREILTNTRDLVEKMCLEVVYGDTDSIMINTNSIDYEQVLTVGNKIKQEINKMYKQIELDIEGVFKYLLLLKKKKYAAVALTKTKTGDLREEKEYKGLDIVRRDWSRLAAETGKFILEHILSDLSPDDRIKNIHGHLSRLQDDLTGNKVPLRLLVITKQLAKDPKMYTDKNSQPHVQIALRYNRDRGGHLRAGDTVSYVICDDGSNKPATQRAYHVEEFKNSTTLKIDVNYYLSQQIHPVVSRICDPIEGLDAYQIADCLGIRASSFKRTKGKSDALENNTMRPEIKFRDVKEFVFKCGVCKSDNTVGAPFKDSNVPFLEKCDNPECTARPVEYLRFVINQLTISIQDYIKQYYLYVLICEDPGCPNETARKILLWSVGGYPVCTLCKKAVMYQKYTVYNLYMQLSFFQHIFDIRQLTKKPLMDQTAELAYHKLRQNVERFLDCSAFSEVDLTELFSGFCVKDTTDTIDLTVLNTVDE